MTHADTCSVKPDKLNKTCCKGLSHWPFCWSLQLFPLFILPEHTIWDEASKPGGIKCSSPVGWWGLQTQTGAALGSWAPFACRGSRHFSEHRHLRASVQGENLHLPWMPNYRHTYVLHNICGAKYLQHFTTVGRVKSPRLSILGDFSVWPTHCSNCIMNARPHAESCRTRVLSEVSSGWQEKSNGGQTSVQFISVNMCSQIVLRLHFDENFKLVYCGTICEWGHPLCPLATPSGAWGQLLAVARGWSGLGKWSVCKIILFLFTGVLYRQIIRLVRWKGSEMFVWVHGQQRRWRDRISAPHTHCQFNTLELQPR